jgi:hypothetical protein
MRRRADGFLRKRFLIHPGQGARFGPFEQGLCANTAMQA